MSFQNLWLYATRSITTAEVIDKLRKHSNIFGNPRRIISDHGTAFHTNSRNIVMKIQYILIITGIPRANGQVEHVNRTLIPFLSKLSAPNPSEWHKHLYSKISDATPSHNIDTTPFNLLFGIDFWMKEDPKIRELVENEWIGIFNEQRDELRKQAKESILKIQEENKRSFNRKRKRANKYREDDLVAIKKMQVRSRIKICSEILWPLSDSKNIAKRPIYSKKDRRA